MRIAPWLIAVFVAGPVGAQQASPKPALASGMDDRYAQMLRRFELRERAYELRPLRRDEPLRYENITDNEVREIQLVAEKFVPRSIVNISPVTTGCPCEEGPQCTDQVFIVANSADKSTGLQLSRIKNAWIVGVVQQWWIRYDALLARSSKMHAWDFHVLEAELLRELPQCVGELIPVKTEEKQ